jgi:hypothetical protein
MFLVQDTHTEREEKLKMIISEDPSLGALLAVVYFEWTVRRAIIALGKSPNVEIRENLHRSRGGLDGYKKVWKHELSSKLGKRLPEVVTGWENLRRAFKLRNNLVHGVTSCSSDYAKERAVWALDAAIEVRRFCLVHNVNLDCRLPVRRKKR